MPTATDGFGLFDAPFAPGGGLPSFSIPSFGAAGGSGSGGGSAPSVPTAAAAPASGGGLFDSFIGVIGNAVGRAADFGAQLFVYDELAERGQAPATVGGTVNTPVGGTAKGSASSNSFIKGVPNEVLFIGIGVVVLLLLLFMKSK